MIVCVCSNINDSKLRNLIKCNKIKSIRDFHKLNVCCNCAKCYKEVQEIIKDESDIHQNCYI
jgi:bacterioferritin-associated ferredoxin